MRPGAWGGRGVDSRLTLPRGPGVDPDGPAGADPLRTRRVPRRGPTDGDRGPPGPGRRRRLGSMGACDRDPARGPGGGQFARRGIGARPGRHRRRPFGLELGRRDPPRGAVGASRPRYRQPGPPGRARTPGPVLSPEPRFLDDLDDRGKCRDERIGTPVVPLRADAGLDTVGRRGPGNGREGPLGVERREAIGRTGPSLVVRRERGDPRDRYGGDGPLGAATVDPSRRGRAVAGGTRARPRRPHPLGGDRHRPLGDRVPRPELRRGAFGAGRPRPCRGGSAPPPGGRGRLVRRGRGPVRPSARYPNSRRGDLTSGRLRRCGRPLDGARSSGGRA